MGLLDYRTTWRFNDTPNIPGRRENCKSEQNDSKVKLIFKKITDQNIMDSGKINSYLIREMIVNSLLPSLFAVLDL